MADDEARAKIQKLLVTGDNRLKQGVSPDKVRATYEEALAVAREARGSRSRCARWSRSGSPTFSGSLENLLDPDLQLDVVVAGGGAAGEGD